MLGIVSSCAIVTLSLRGAVFTIFDFKKCRDLEIGVRSLKVIESGTIRKIVYGFLLVFLATLSLKRTVFEIFDFKIAVTLKTGLGSVKVIRNVTVR